MEFLSLIEFDKDLKKLVKRYRTLPGDLEVVRKVLQIRPDASPPFSFRIDGLGLESCIIKVKKIASDSFKGRGNNSGFRLVYDYSPDKQMITFIEIYHKSDKEKEEKERILRNFR